MTEFIVEHGHQVAYAVLSAAGLPIAWGIIDVTFLGGRRSAAIATFLGILMVSAGLLGNVARVALIEDRIEANSGLAVDGPFAASLDIERSWTVNGTARKCTLVHDLTRRPALLCRDAKHGDNPNYAREIIG